MKHSDFNNSYSTVSTNEIKGNNAEINEVERIRKLLTDSIALVN